MEFILLGFSLIVGILILALFGLFLEKAKKQFPDLEKYEPVPLIVAGVLAIITFYIFLNML